MEKKTPTSSKVVARLAYRTYFCGRSVAFDTTPYPYQQRRTRQRLCRRPKSVCLGGACSSGSDDAGCAAHECWELETLARRGN